ncbi:ubiquitin-conjugating enzyme [Lasiosphaeria miniovina]|uniref:Ubiquitin-conjugating enzyme n=1 Tax=Lasiosphaeria miniovina TaxID=1954250 RepID=A0AA40B5D7_9PEZI|nr:ubiquitin-conjugating enzyme [Lasiosphaeria miniovina]KAK0728020.1 ubiquitin-conjugating enzyme [Lasiosphaeria miniovina]
MATPKFNSKSPTIRRILREAQELSSSPSGDYTATPLESDLFEWHFTLRGPPNSVYADGIYHGRIVLPPGYPLRPPSFRFVTPSGRFETNREICLSISGHHEETWQPAWGVRTALVALRSFMETDPRGQLGGLETTDAVRRRLATASREWRCSSACSAGRTNAEIMRDCETVAREHQGGEKVEVQVEIPPELKLAWRDEMGENASAGASATETLRGTAATVTTTTETRRYDDGNNDDGDDDDDESAELAEGFVQTTSQPLAPPPPVPVPAPAISWQPQPQPQLTRTIPLPPQQQAYVPPRRVSNGDVPVWIDRLIVIVGVVLAAMIIRVFLGE